MENRGLTTKSTLSRAAPYCAASVPFGCAATPSGAGVASATDAPPTDPEASALWDRLRTLRLRLAQEQGLPPYVIFSDASLTEMVRYRPRDAGELGRVSGVGLVKLER